MLARVPGHLEKVSEREIRRHDTPGYSGRHYAVYPPNVLTRHISKPGQAHLAPPPCLHDCAPLQRRPLLFILEHPHYEQRNWPPARALATAAGLQGERTLPVGSAQIDRAALACSDRLALTALPRTHVSDMLLSVVLGGRDRLLNA